MICNHPCTSKTEFERHLERTSAYGERCPEVTSSSLPYNPTLRSLASGLAAAHQEYGFAHSVLATATGILFVVQPNNVNICDERPIEDALWDMGIPSYRVEFGAGVLASIELTSSREMLLRPPPSPSARPIEISVVYMRAGYDVEEYDDEGCLARYQLERSRAIKCPSLLSHMSTLKKVQQALAMPGALTRFITSEEATQIARTFAPMFPLDDSELGKRARDLACNADTAANYVLKPCLEGGGHNIYRKVMPQFLKSIPDPLWHTYILMEIIEPPIFNNTLMSPKGLYSGSVISELGIFGVCLWRRGPKGVEVIQNKEAGFSFKTKGRDVDEMSVVKGYGCFDSPCLY